MKLHFIETGTPVQNAFIESFNGKFRDECLNQNWFVSLAKARQIIEAWRVDYNTVRPHSSLGYRTPEEFAAQIAALRSPSAPYEPQFAQKGKPDSRPFHSRMVEALECGKPA